MKKIILEQDVSVFDTLPGGFARLIYIDPPFNTGHTQIKKTIRVQPSDSGDRVGFGGRSYTTEVVGIDSFEDKFDDYEGFLIGRIQKALRCLTPDGSLFVHLNCKEVHYIKVALDKLLGRDHFINEIIWAYDYGARSKKRWPAKHDNILWYAMDPNKYVFNYDAIDRIPYMAPGLVGPEKAAAGKTPTDVWWHTIVPTNGKERTGYPTQKPLGILNRIVKVHSNPGDVVFDFFAGSGTTGEAAALHGRGFVLIDKKTSAVQTSAKRLVEYKPELIGFEGETK